MTPHALALTAALRLAALLKSRAAKETWITVLPPNHRAAHDDDPDFALWLHPLIG